MSRFFYFSGDNDGKHARCAMARSSNTDLKKERNDALASQRFYPRFHLEWMYVESINV